MQGLQRRIYTEETLLEKNRSVVSVNPTFCCVGLDLGKIEKLDLGWKRQRS